MVTNASFVLDITRRTDGWMYVVISRFGTRYGRTDAIRPPRFSEKNNFYRSPSRMIFIEIHIEIYTVQKRPTGESTNEKQSAFLRVLPA